MADGWSNRSQSSSDAGQAGHSEHADPVELLLRKMAEGATLDDPLDAYPRLTKSDIQACLAYAAEAIAHEEICRLSPEQPSLRFLADESCDFAAVRALRSAGHDVLAVGEFQQRSVDQEIMETA